MGKPELKPWKHGVSVEDDKQFWRDVRNHLKDTGEEYVFVAKARYYTLKYSLLRFAGGAGVGQAFAMANSERCPLERQAFDAYSFLIRLILSSVLNSCFWRL